MHISRFPLLYVPGVMLLVSCATKETTTEPRRDGAVAANNGAENL
jgi:hypothetical protein